MILYQLRYLIENAFLHLKRWRGIATRYAKNAASLLALVHIRCIVPHLPEMDRPQFALESIRKGELARKRVN
jgi:hypothetical protein